MTPEHKEFMALAIQLASNNVEKSGGPFGAVIVKNGKILSKSANSVTNDNDPTAHAEVNAIRKACKEIASNDLSGCILYSSCEPCPMCLGAIYWAHLDELYFACGKDDAAKSGFDDAFIYEEMELSYKKRKLTTNQFMRKEGLQSFKKWDEFEDKVEY
jgi:tRNA(Arg) A34 adenosine deaminase TadA